MNTLLPPSECYEELDQFPWLQRCGIVFSNDDVVFEPSEDRAISLISSPDYDDHQLERQNDLTLFLHEHHRAEYREWNEIVRYSKKRLSALLEGFDSLCEQRGFPIEIAHSIRWDVIAYCQEIAFAGFGISDYHRRAMEVYQSGHLLCGYTGNYPGGRYIAY